MRRPRISIAGLMVFVVFLGITFAALRTDTESWSRVMLSLAIASNGVALIGRLSTRSPNELAWTGYLIFGAGYLVLCIGPWCDEHIMPHLVTTPLIDDHYTKLQYTPTHAGERVWTTDGPGRGFAGGETFGDIGAETASFNVAHDRGTTSRYNATQLRAISPDGYRRLCHSTISFWTGLLGALLARCLRGINHDNSMRRAASGSA